MSKNITIARLNTLVTANATQFSQEMDRAAAIAKTKGRSINTALSAIGSTLGAGLSIGAGVAFGKSIVDLGSRITDLSSFADMGARSFQTLSVLAGDGGVKMEEVAKASETMRQKLQDAKDKASDPLNASLRKLGLSAQGLSALDTDQKWQVIADRLVHAKDQQLAMNIASDIFGTKVGPKLRGALERVAGGLDKASANMGGLILTDAQLQRIDEFGDRMERLGRFAKIFTVNLLDGSVGFQTLWRDAKAMAGYGEKLSKTDIRTPGEYVLPGSKLTARNSRQELEDKMLEAQKKVWVENDASYRKELAAIKRREAFRQRDPQYWLKQRKEATDYKDNLMELVLGRSESLRGLSEDIKRKTSPTADLNIPTDAYARIGLMTSDKTPPEQKAQTEHLKQIEDTLKKIRALLASPNTQNLAAYAN